MNQKIFLALMLFVLISPLAKANTDLVVQCDSCDQFKKQLFAEKKALNSMTAQEFAASTPNIKLVSVIDLVSDTIISFKITTVRLPSSPTNPVWGHQSVLITPPITAKSKFDQVIVSKKGIGDKIKGITIPSSVVENAWEFVNCAYCSNTVQEYIRSQTQGQVESLFQTLNALFNTLGIFNSPMPSTYEIPLESGGYIVLETSIGGDLKLNIKVTKVVDKDLNTVPNASTDLKGSTFFISSLANGATINFYVSGFGLYLPERIGIVTMIECPPGHVGSFCH